MSKAVKTTFTTQSVDSFLADLGLSNKKFLQANELITVFEEVAGVEAEMFGPSIIGFGRYQYTYATGHQGVAPVIAFSPKKNQFNLYVTTDEAQRNKWLPLLGKHRSGKSCVYVNKLEDIDLSILKELLQVTINEIDTHQHYQRIT